MKSKLVYVLPKFEVDSATHFNHTYNLLKYLNEEYDLVVMIEKSDSKDYPVYFNKVITVKHEGYFKRMIETLACGFKLRRLGHKSFYVHCSTFATICLSPLRLLGVKVFFWHCGESHKYFKKLGEKGWLHNKLHDHWSLLLALKLCTKLITGTDKMKMYYYLQYGTNLEKIESVPNDIDLLNYQTTKNLIKDTPTFLFVHHLTERKGADRIVPIGLEILKLEPHAHFVICGNGTYMTKLREEIKIHNLGIHFEVLGGIPNNQIKKQFAKADVYFMPSREEGMPRTLLESMATKTPYVATMVGGIYEMSRHAHYVYQNDKFNAKEFAELCVKTLRDPDKEKVIQESFDWVQQYDTPKIVSRLKEVLV